MSNESQGRTTMVQGRIVWTCGDLFKGAKMTDARTKQPILDRITGQQKVQYGFGLAVPKSVLGQTGAGQPGEIWAAMHNEAFTLYPNNNGQLPPKFAMKYKDGDKDVDHNGKPYSAREGYPGHIVLSCTTHFPVKFFRYENNNNIQVNDGIKCGDYVNVQLLIKAHGPVNNGDPGLYLNPLAAQFLGYGKEISNAPSGDQIFGTVAPPMPVGASATPVAPAGMLVPTGTPTPAAYGQPPMPGYSQPQAAPAPAQPYYNVLPPQHQPQGPAPVANGHMPAPAFPQPSMPAPMPHGFPVPQ